MLRDSKTAEILLSSITLWTYKNTKDDVQVNQARLSCERFAVQPVLRGLGDRWRRQKLSCQQS
jgi:hypothetical protein